MNIEQVEQPIHELASLRSRSMGEATSVENIASSAIPEPSLDDPHARWRAYAAEQEAKQSLKEDAVDEFVAFGEGSMGACYENGWGVDLDVERAVMVW